MVQAALDQGEASARMTLQTFLRPAPPRPDRSSIGRHMAPSTGLAGRNVLVVGFGVLITCHLNPVMERDRLITENHGHHVPMYEQFGHNCAH